MNTFFVILAAIVLMISFMAVTCMLFGNDRDDDDDNL